jgi:hypothetical protein
MGVFQNNLMGAAAAAASASTDFYEYQIANSIRGSAADDRTLKWTAGTPTSRDTFTMAYWVKRQTDSTTDSANNIFVTGTGGGTYFYISLGLDLFFEGAGGNWSTSYLQTNAAYRDTSAWYHHILVFDSTQSDENDRLKIYVNGERITSFAQDSMHGNIGSSEDFSFINQSGIVQAWGGLSGKGHGTEGADLSLADVMFFDGQAYYSELGETKNGVWIPKDPSGLTFGDNGYWLKFESSSDLGNDSSGNNNDFTVANFSSHDQLLDSPTFGSSNGGNFPTYNPLLKPPSGLTLAEGNLKATLTSNNTGIMTNWQVPVTGKWYWEVDVDNIASGHGVYIGVMPANTDLTINQESNNLGLVYYSANGNSILKGTRSSYGDTWDTGDIISIAVDRDADTIQFYKNGSGQGTIDISSLDKEFFCYMGNTGGTGSCRTILNFGQDGTFAGEVTAGGNSDGTGYGNFKYSVPSGFLALCSGNQPVADEIDPAQTDDDYPQKLFGAKLYTGDSSTQAITGLGFQPDWVWIKERENSSTYGSYDSSRGNTNVLGMANTTAAEVSQSADPGLESFDSDGFTVDYPNTGDYYINRSSEPYVAWNWRANGGTTSTNSSGTIDSAVQVDPSGCFSIITYTGDGSNSVFTVGHGLSAKPTFIIAKDREQVRNWSVWSQHLNGGSPADGDTLYLNTTAAESDQGGSWDVSNITSTLIGGVDGGFLNTGTNKQLFYAFTDCEGYIKSGVYEGNGNADGSFVYTGFRPAFILLKSIDSTDDWVLYDNKIGAYNEVTKALATNLSNAEQTSNRNLDILSNGFKPRTSNSNVNGSNTYIYLAMAHNPFKYATAR